MSTRPRRLRLFPLKLTFAAAIVLGVGACNSYRVRSQLIPAPTVSGDLFRCAQLELGRSGYAIVGADRASRWLHAQRRIDRSFRSPERAEIYVTVIPDETGDGSHLQLTDNSHATADADQLRERCIAPTE